MATRIVRTPLPKPPKAKKPRRGIKAGRKVNRWNYIRQCLKKEFTKLGIERCEICGTTENLSFAHRLKRRFIMTDKELRTVALLCIFDHEILERGSHKVMFDAITQIIENRNS